MTSVELKPATPELLARFYGGTPKKTSNSIVALDGDRIIGIAGIYHENGVLVAFSEMSDECRKNKRLLIHGCRMLQMMIEQAGATVHAIADARIKGSDILLNHLGFQPADKGVWSWPA